MRRRPGVGLDGWAGQLAALVILMLLLAVIWIMLALPVLDLWNRRQALLEQREVLARRMADVSASLPAFDRAAGVGSANDSAPASLLDGATDAIAAASLQERLQAMAGRTGAALATTETLSVVQAGAFRQIGLRVGLRAPWPVLVRMLQQIEMATPRMLVDDLQVHGTRLATAPPDQPLEVGFTVLAFRAAAAAAVP